MTIEVEIVKDSQSMLGPRLTTFKLKYPRMVHSEIMTHRIFSRNASSSRAIPVKKMIEDVMTDPAMPERWGLMGSGMQDHGEMTIDGIYANRDLWLRARDAAVEIASRMLIQTEVPHKQIINRLLEPFMHITVVLSATEFSNFFALRRHKDADPTIYKLADMMWDEYRKSKPIILNYNEWHIPFTDEADILPIEEYIRQNHPFEIITESQFKEKVNYYLIIQSVARCARTSYSNFLYPEEKRSTLNSDIALYEKLVGSQPIHASPAEHQGKPDTGKAITNSIIEYDNPRLHGNFTGFIQFRKTLLNENIAKYYGN